MYRITIGDCSPRKHVRMHVRTCSTDTMLWNSKRQNFIATSSASAEHMWLWLHATGSSSGGPWCCGASAGSRRQASAAQRCTAKDVIYLSQLYMELGFKIEKVPLFVGASAATCTWPWERRSHIEGLNILPWEFFRASLISRTGTRSVARLQVIERIHHATLMSNFPSRGAKTTPLQTSNQSAILDLRCNACKSLK